MEETKGCDRSGRRSRYLLLEFLIDFPPSLLEPFHCLRGRLFQLLLNFISKMLFLDLLCRLGKSLFYFIPDFLGSAPDPFDHRAVVAWLALSQRCGTRKGQDWQKQPDYLPYLSLQLHCLLSTLRKAYHELISRSDGSRASHCSLSGIFCGYIGSLKPDLFQRQATDANPVSILPEIRMIDEE